ncbi:MAG: Mut7-C RNAse domain-containing protein [Candidatus Hodarchaeota archaeon]
MSRTEPMFICDSMLARLGRWLRLLGYDTVLSKHLNDDELMQIISDEGGESRILITRDLDLYRRAVKKGLEAFLLTSNSHIEQIAEITHHYNLEVLVDPALSRCPRCNGQLENTKDTDKLANLVSTNTLRAYEDFWLCRQCKQVFWQGRMWPNIMNVVKRIKDLKNELKSTD